MANRAMQQTAQTLAHLSGEDQVAEAMERIVYEKLGRLGHLTYCVQCGAVLKFDPKEKADAEVFRGLCPYCQQ